MSEASDRDAGDPLGPFREKFDLPDGLIYLDGNSLGPLLHSVRDRVADVVSREWGQDLITSWNRNGWMELAGRVGGKLAPIIGADPEDVIACDSTSVNIFKLMSAALKLNPGRPVILSEKRNFPTDLYIAQGLVEYLGAPYEVRLIEDGVDVADHLSNEIGLVMLTQVDYRTGRKLDMAGITEAVHKSGALVLWDLAHSAGAFPVDLRGANADFAVGCGYKYLNGGPGAPAFLYCAKAHQDRIQPLMSGWLGHASPFDFSSDYAPAPGIARHIVGTPPVLSLAALDEALTLFEAVDLNQLAAKSAGLTAFFMDEVARHSPDHGLSCVTPIDAGRRGSQVSYRHSNGYAVMQALIDHGVIGDFRDPDIIRFGFAPLYNSYQDVETAAETLAEILEQEIWQDPRYQTRSAVT